MTLSELGVRNLTDFKIIFSVIITCFSKSHISPLRFPISVITAWSFNHPSSVFQGKFYLISYLHLSEFLNILFSFSFEGRICGIWKFWVRDQTGAAAASLHHSPSNTGIWVASTTYAAAGSNARSLTHWVRPGMGTHILMDTMLSSWPTEPQWELLLHIIIIIIFLFKAALRHMEVPRLGKSFSCIFLTYQPFS